MKEINQLIENYLNWSNDSKKFIKIFQILFYYIPAILIPLGVLITIIHMVNRWRWIVSNNLIDFWNYLGSSLWLL